MAVRKQPEAGLRCILAPNPSMMTQNGTNTYILGQGRVAVIDPGPDNSMHLAAILAALLPGEAVSHILVTHAHLDHSALVPRLALATGAPVYGFGPAGAGQSAAMQRLADRGDIGGGEGVDRSYRPDVVLADGDRVTGDDWQIEALHTPGHMGDHLCFASAGHLFSGDHVMGWSSSLISPPDGDMTDYMASLQRLEGRHWASFWPGHGAVVADPALRLDALIAHRRQREAEVLAALAADIGDLAGLAARVYPDLTPALLPAARRNLLAHLIDLEGRNLVVATPDAGPDANFACA